MKRWQRRPPTGAAVGRADVRMLARRGDPGTQPVVFTTPDGRVVAYSATRFKLRRDAYRRLFDADDVLLLHIRPKGETPFAVALSRREIDDVFGEIFSTRSWEQHPYEYHFPKLPPAVESFRLDA